MIRISFWRLLDDVPAIEIPVIQRDYVQGRDDARAKNIAARFVSSLNKAINERLNDKDSHPLLLDFIFGSSDSGIFVPFDGQQRLTTLWLLHLYTASNASALDDAVHKRLGQFHYAVREDSALFCKTLLQYMSALSAKPELWNQQNLKKLIQIQPWFLPQWKQDPTIKNMLNMLEDIHTQFHNQQSAWELLTLPVNPPVMFYFQDIAELKTRGDELFIKMNARGKQLTEFEIFKARFLEWLESHAKNKKSDFTKYLNHNWQDLFWEIFGKSSTKKDKTFYSDECFCNFLRFFATMLQYFSSNFADTTASDEDLFCLVVKAVQKGAPSPVEEGNLSFLENVLNALQKLEATPGGIKAFFDDIFLAADDPTLPVCGKISWFRNNHVNMFEEVCSGKPTLPDREMLFACLLLLAGKNKLGPDDRLHLRVLRNLLANSTSENYEAKLPELLPDIVDIVQKGEINLSSAFNTYQLKEEMVKLHFRESSRPKDCRNLDWLEDHPLLRGCLAIFTKMPGKRSNPVFDVQTVNCGKEFFENVLCNDYVWDIVLKGFLTCGKFGMQDSPQYNKYIYLGAQRNNYPLDKRNIFTTIREDSFDGIRESVQELAQIVCKSKEPAGKAINKWVKSWLAGEKNFTWRWYFVKYKAMRPDAREACGRYDWGYSPRSFEQRELRKKTLIGPHWNPFLWAVYVEAGFNEENAKDMFKNKIEWKDADDYGYDISQIVFTIEGTKLALWPHEFFWQVRGPSGGLGPKATQKLKTLVAGLAKRKIRMLADGTYFIKGQDSAPVDYNDFSWENVRDIYRLYDTEDRIKKGVLIAKALANL